MPRRRLITDKQIEKLVEILEQNPCLALGHINGPLVTQTLNNMWEQISATLNGISGGVQKSGHAWRLFWNEQKYKVRKKAAELHKHGTGEGRFRKPLQPFEIRMLAIIEQSLKEGDVLFQNNKSLEISQDEDSLTKLHLDVKTKELTDAGDEDSRLELQDCHLETEGKLKPIYKRRYSECILNEQLNHAAQTETWDSDKRQRHKLKRLCHRLKRQQESESGVETESEPPQWILDLEERRLDVDRQLAQSLNRLAGVLEKMEAKMP